MGNRTRIRYGTFVATGMGAAPLLPKTAPADPKKAAKDPNAGTLARTRCWAEGAQLTGKLAAGAGTIVASTVGAPVAALGLAIAGATALVVGGCMWIYIFAKEFFRGEAVKNQEREKQAIKARLGATKEEKDEDEKNRANRRGPGNSGKSRGKTKTFASIVGIAGAIARGVGAYFSYIGAAAKAAAVTAGRALGLAGTGIWPYVYIKNRFNKNVRKQVAYDEKNRSKEMRKPGEPKAPNAKTNFWKKILCAACLSIPAAIAAFVFPPVTAAIIGMTVAVAFHGIWIKCITLNGKKKLMRRLAWEATHPTVKEEPAALGKTTVVKKEQGTALVENQSSIRRSPLQASPCSTSTPSLGATSHPYFVTCEKGKKAADGSYLDIAKGGRTPQRPLLSANRSYVRNLTQ